MSLRKAFASVLRAMRASRGMTQRKLAEASIRTYLSRLERGQSSPTVEMVTALSGTKCQHVNAVHSYAHRVLD